MNRSLIPAILCLLLLGCQETEMRTSKEEAYKQWAISRANTFQTLAAEHLKFGHLDKAEEKATEALQLRPNDVELRLLLSRIRIEQGQYRQAAEMLVEIRDSQPENSEAHYLLGVVKERQKDFPVALEHYNNAAVAAPQDIHPVMACAEVLVAMGKVDQAQRRLESGLHLAESEPGAFELAGRIATLHHEYDKAVKYYREARALDPENRRYAELLAGAYLNSGQIEPASAVLKDLVSLPEYTPPLRVYMMLGDISLASGNLSEARQAYHRALSREPENAQARLGLAKISLIRGQWVRAAEEAQEARRHAPDNVEIATVLAYALLRRSEAEAALDILVPLRRAHPDDAMIHTLMGRAHEQLGRHRQARQMYALASRLDPNNALARRLVQSPR